MTVKRLVKSQRFAHFDIGGVFGNVMVNSRFAKPHNPYRMNPWRRFACSISVASAAVQVTPFCCEVVLCSDIKGFIFWSPL